MMSVLAYAVTCLLCRIYEFFLMRAFGSMGRCQDTHSVDPLMHLQSSCSGFVLCCTTEISPFLLEVGRLYTLQDLALLLIESKGCLRLIQDHPGHARLAARLLLAQFAWRL